MAHSAAWDETAPAGSALASTLDDVIREFKRDARQRLELDHIWNTSLDHDGKHAKVTLRPSANVIPIATEAANSITGSTVGGLIDLSQTWNTSGVSKAIKVDITNTASGSGSLLMDLKVGGTTVFAVDLTGTVTVGSISGAGLGNVSASSNFGTDNVLVRSDGTSKNVQASGISVNDSDDVSGIAILSYEKSDVFSWNTKSMETVYTAPSDGFVVITITNDNGEAKVYSDTSNPPTTVRAHAGKSVGLGTSMCPVKKGHYWQAKKIGFYEPAAVFTVYWVPLGTGGA